MEKFKIKVKRKNGKKRIVTVYLDDTTAQLLKQTGDKKLLYEYLRDEYVSSRKARRYEFWNQSLEEDAENGIDYEYVNNCSDFSFDDMEDERLQTAIKQLTPRQREILRLKYIEGRSQNEIAAIFGVKKAAICNAVRRIYELLKKNY